MKSLLLAILILSGMTETGNAENIKNRVSVLSSSIWMRALSSSIKDLCAGAKQDCGQQSYTVDPYEDDVTAATAIKDGFIKDNPFKTKLVSVPDTQIKNTLKEVLHRAEISKSATTEAYYKTILANIDHIKKEYKMTVFEGIGFSAAGYSSYLLILIKNSKFDMGEALVISAGPTEYFGGIGLPAGVSAPKEYN